MARKQTTEAAIAQLTNAVRKLKDAERRCREGLARDTTPAELEALAQERIRAIEHVLSLVKSAAP